MYEERRDTFSVRDIILQILFVILFVLILLWLFPTKGYVKKLINNKGEQNVKVEASQSDIDKLSVLYNQIFANNIKAMKDAAVGYYTNERLPKNIGDTEKMTLQQMYDKHLVLKLTDKEGNPCDPVKSYVEITKYKNEYRLKVNLSCTNEEDYIIVYLGCYDYCDGNGICEKVEPKPTPTPTPTPTKYSCKIVNGKYYDKNGNIVSKAAYEKSCSSAKKYVCEYKKVTNGYWGPFGEWSAWTKNKITANESTLVQTKKVIEITGYTTKKVQVGTKIETYIKGYNYEKYISGYKTEKYISGYKEIRYISGYQDIRYISGYKTEKYISGYTTQKVQVGTKKVQVGTTKKTVTKKVAVGTTNVYVSSGSGTTIPANGNGYIYVKTGSKTTQSCSSCATITTYTWDKYKVTTVYKTVTTTEEVPVYKTEPIYEEKQVPVYKTRQVPQYSTKKEPIYSTKKEPIYSTRKIPVYSTRKVPVYGTRKVPVYENKKVPVYTTVTYYRSRTRKYIGGTQDIKWSTCDPVDSSLINKGYTLTGKRKQA